VTAQSHSQHTAAYTVGTLIGVALSMLTTPTSAAAWLLFGVLSALQMFAVHKATTSVALSSLDASRGPELVRQYLSRERLSTPEEIRRIERFEWPFFVGISSSKVRLEVGASPLVFATEVQLQLAVETANGKPFLTKWDPQTRIASVVLHSRANDEDKVEGVFEVLRSADFAANQDVTFGDFVGALKEAGWTMEHNAMETTSRQIRVEWD
jgi:hypothetical protein